MPIILETDESRRVYQRLPGETAMADCIEVVCEINGGPAQAINVWHFQSVMGGTAAAMSTASSELLEFYTALKQYLGTGLSVVIGTKVTYLGTTPPGLLSFTPITVSSTGSTRMPASSAIAITWRTAVASRSTRGRTFFGPLVQLTADSTTGRVNSSVANDIRTAAQKLVDDSATAGNPLVVYSRKNNDEEPVTVAAVNTRFDTQRRRLGD